MKNWSLARSMMGSSGMNAFLDGPDVAAIRVAMAMRGEKSATMLPEQGPDLFMVRLGQWKRIEFVPAKEAELAFAVICGQRFQARAQFEEEHEPMRFAFVAVLADDAGEVQGCGRDFEGEFLERFAAGTRVRRFAGFDFQLAAARTPKTAIGWLGAMHE